MLMFLAVAVFFVFSYHFLRNGIPWKFYGTEVARAIWGISFTIGYTILAMPNDSFIAGGIIAPLQFIAMLVPHAAFQNMGTWATPQKDWPAFWLPTKTQAQWDAMSPAGKTSYDFMGMLSVGIVRALIVYGVSGGVLMAFGEQSWLSISAAIVAALSQPVAYLVGKYVPFSMWATPAKSSGWGEVGVGIGWAISLAVYVGFKIFV